MGLNVLIASPEATPFAKTGGLAEVAGSLTVALKDLGCNVALIIPFHRQVAEGNFDVKPVDIDVMVPAGLRKIGVEVLKGTSKGVPVFFIRRDEYFDRSFLYGTPEGDYFDNIERFAFFSRAVIETAKAIGFRPDVIHCNDWQTGLVPAYLRDSYSKDPFFSKTAIVFTIHNIAYQGVFPAELFGLTGLSPGLFGPEGLEFWGRISLLKAGLVYSGMLTTVSTAYSREIQTEEHGAGLEGVLRKRSKDLHGVLNGIDYGEWNPETDPLIPARYSEKDLRGKARCKQALLKEFGLELKAGTPLIGMISRLTEQKGFDILCEAMPAIMERGPGMVILGSGDRKYQDLIKGLAVRYPEKLSVRIAFDHRLSHLVEAGSDIFLMPSRYEPCGLNQMYSLRYGTVPVVRATGGLDDTVRDYAEPSPNGFKFAEYAPEALTAKVMEAIAAYGDKKAWKALQTEGIREVFSWEVSAGKYMDIYTKACSDLHKGNL
ncbi:MAG: glycogen synthase GlgA [Deltaproteobacteria bacterium]|nr:glycogen synthase GlgA [Deltaproteobacteria bacterium]